MRETQKKGLGKYIMRIEREIERESPTREKGVTGLDIKARPWWNPL